MDVDEDPKEDPKEEIPLAIASPPGSPPISPPPLSGLHPTLTLRLQPLLTGHPGCYPRAGGAGPVVVGGNAGGVGGNARGVIEPKARGCTYKTFLGCNPFTFNGMEGAAGQSRWIEKLESVFQISKCANEDKVKYDACTLQGRALT
nr:hypothetical protein [Tanacetum cinerariifolium]